MTAATPSEIDFAALAKGTKATDLPLPETVPGRRTAEPSPFAALVQKAIANPSKRFDLPGRFDTTPYEGRVGASECQTIVNALHKAARQLGVKLAVRRVEPTATDAGLRFAVAPPKDGGASTTSK